MKRGASRRSATAWSELAPFLRDRVGELATWDDIKLLTVAIDRLRQWYRPGLLCIGDAAHAMSPVGGVGINLAVQDAVAAANILAEPLRAGAVTREHLDAVQQRRDFPDEGHPAHAGRRAEQPAVARAGKQRRPKPPFVDAAAQVFSGAAPNSRADDRHRRAARTHPRRRSAF